MAYMYRRERFAVNGLLGTASIWFVEVTAFADVRRCWCPFWQYGSSSPGLPF